LAITTGCAPTVRTVLMYWSNVVLGATNPPSAVWVCQW